MIDGGENNTDTDLTNPPFRKRGYVQVYTGRGKGKTTASVGLALRALGKNWKVLIMQFTKGGAREKYGEYNSLNSLDPKFKKNLKYKNCGIDKVIFKNNLTDEDILEAKKGWWYILHNYKEYDLIVMDEINIALELGMLELDKVIEFIKNKPKRLELVLTGRISKPLVKERLYEVSHLISEIEPIKHYYEEGVLSREGIEW